MGHSRPLFLYFRLFNFNVQLVDKVCRCWDSRISGVGSDRSTNWATTTAQELTKVIRGALGRVVKWLSGVTLSINMAVWPGWCRDGHKLRYPSVPGMGAAFGRLFQSISTNSSWNIIMSLSSTANKVAYGSIHNVVGQWHTTTYL